MKNLTVFLVLMNLLGYLKGVHSSIYEDTFKNLVEQCRNEGSYTQEDVDEVMSLKQDIGRGAQCLTACADEKYGFIKGGKYGIYKDTEEILRKLFADDQSVLDNIKILVNKCYGKATKKGKGDICSASKYVVHCFVENTK